MHCNRAKLFPIQEAITVAPPFTGNLVKARFKDKELTTLPATPQSKTPAAGPPLVSGSLAPGLGTVHLKTKGKPMRNLGPWAMAEVAS
jgi:hypothetical protein